jgi:hypothetical protein
MPNAIPQTNNGAGGAGGTDQTAQAMQAATAQMQQLFAEQMTFSSEQEALKAGIQTSQSIPSPGVGG